MIIISSLKKYVNKIQYKNTDIAKKNCSVHPAPIRNINYV